MSELPTTAKERVLATIELAHQAAVDTAIAANMPIVLVADDYQARRFAGQANGRVTITHPVSGTWTPSLASCLAGANVVIAAVGVRPALGEELAAEVFAAGARKVRFVRLGDFSFDGLVQAANAVPALIRDEPSDGEVVPLAEHRAVTIPRSVESPDAIPCDWPEIIPLESENEVDDFPIDSLPPVVREMVEAVARSTASPVEFCGTVALGAIAALTARAVTIEAPGAWSAPANLYVTTVLPVGQGKTPVFRRFTAVLDEIEAEWMARAWPAINDARTRQKVAKEQAAKAEKDAAAGKASTSDAVRLAEEAQEIVVPPEPRVLTKDATPEALIRVCSANGGTLAVLSDEGAEVFQSMSRYSGNGSANFGPFLAGHDGDRYVSDRVSRETVQIRRLVLTLVLTVQPSVLEDLSRDRDNRERGFLARFLLCQPPSAIGYRSTDDEPIPEAVTAGWETMMRRLADEVWTRRDAPTTLTLTPEAESAYRAWRAATEPRLRPFVGDLRDCTDWAAKMQSHVIRLAAILHCAKAATIKGPVDLGTMADAIALVEFFATHVRRAFASMSSTSETRIAERVLAWLRRHERDSFTARDAWQALKGGPVKVMADLEPAIALLAVHGYVRQAPTPERRGPGRPQSPTYFVNPATFGGQR